jgi:hypothetical protein
MRDLEQWLKALVINSGSREIDRVQAYSEAERAGTHPYGLAITWHNGGAAFAHLVHTLPAGRTPGAEWQILDAV